MELSSTPFAELRAERAAAHRSTSINSSDFKFLTVTETLQIKYCFGVSRSESYKIRRPEFNVDNEHSCLY